MLASEAAFLGVEFVGDEVAVLEEQEARCQLGHYFAAHQLEQPAHEIPGHALNYYRPVINNSLSRSRTQSTEGMAWNQSHTCRAVPGMGGSRERLQLFVIMDLILFGSSLSLGLLVGLTLKKHKVYLIPQSLGLAKTNREYFEDVQKEMEEADFANYYATKNSVRHLNVEQK